MKVLAGIMFGVFLFVTIFGLPVLLAHGDHHVGCPLQAAGEVMCESTIIEHFSIWSSMFASMLVSFILLLTFVMVVVPRAVLSAHERVRFRFFARLPARPSLLQELYSQGIHNRKEPYAF